MTIGQNLISFYYFSQYKIEIDYLFTVLNYILNSTAIVSGHSIGEQNWELMRH
jgi:hypothetical protein